MACSNYESRRDMHGFGINWANKVEYKSSENVIDWHLPPFARDEKTDKAKKFLFGNVDSDFYLYRLFVIGLITQLIQEGVYHDRTLFRRDREIIQQISQIKNEMWNTLVRKKRKWEVKSSR